MIVRWLKPWMALARMSRRFSVFLALTVFLIGVYSFIDIIRPRSLTISDTRVASEVEVIQQVNDDDDNPKPVVKCDLSKRRARIEMRGNFWVLYNYVQSDQKACRESITYTTHGDLTFLDNLETLVDRWNDSVSIALYAPGSDFFRCSKSIAYLRNCVHSSIRTLVDFHIFFDVGHVPQQVSTFEYF